MAATAQYQTTALAITTLAIASTGLATRIRTRTRAHTHTHAQHSFFSLDDSCHAAMEPFSLGRLFLMNPYRTFVLGDLVLHLNSNYLRAAGMQWLYYLLLLLLLLLLPFLPAVAKCAISEW